MFSIKDYRTPSKKDLRIFGFILAGGFGIIGLIPTIFRQQAPHTWAVTVALVFGLGGLLVPAALRPAHRIWMALGMILGWINSRIILGAVYYLMITPARLFMALAGYDPMNRAFDQKTETYRVSRKARPASHFDRQF